MATIVTATVIRWKVEDSQEEAQTYYDDEQQVSVYLGDDDAADSSLQVMIIGQYILDQADDEKEFRELLEAARDGLLQVTNVAKQALHPPSVPPRRPEEKKPKRSGKTRKEKAGHPLRARLRARRHVQLPGFSPRRKRGHLVAKAPSLRLQQPRDYG